MALIKLPKMYLSVHALTWLDLPPGDPRRKEKKWDQFPGRCELAYRNELKLKKKIYQLVRDAGEDEGIFILPLNPTEFPVTKKLIKFAQKHFGPRCIVARNPDFYICEGLGDSFFKGLEKDQQQAMKKRGLPINEWGVKYEFEAEFRAWALSKAWAFDLMRQLEERGYTFDPATVEFVVWGGDWSYCSATYPIHMTRAFGLSKPMKRSFKLIDRACTPIFLEATVVEDGASMPQHIRLYIVKTKDNHYVAQYFEGMHGLMDHPHVVVVDFLRGSVSEINLWGEAIERQVGISSGPSRVVMSVGCGGHTRHRATLVKAEKLSPEDFRSALLAGKVVECKW